MYSYIVYYCILIVFCIVGLRVLHGLINLNQSNSEEIASSLASTSAFLKILSKPESDLQSTRNDLVICSCSEVTCRPKSLDCSNLLVILISKMILYHTTRVATNSKLLYGIFLPTVSRYKYKFDPDFATPSIFPP